MKTLVSVAITFLISFPKNYISNVKILLESPSFYLGSLSNSSTNTTRHRLTIRLCEFLKVGHGYEMEQTELFFRGNNPNQFPPPL
jgi:hypothetical protein